MPFEKSSFLISFSYFDDQSSVPPYLEPHRPVRGTQKPSFSGARRPRFVTFRRVDCVLAFEKADTLLTRARNTVPACPLKAAVKRFRVVFDRRKLYLSGN